MNKKVLIISGSPRRGGNSELLCDEFMRGAKENGNNVHKVCLRDKKLHYCNGCQVCYTNGGICVHKDDVPTILKEMIEADVIVMASPVYFYSINAQMKTLIDRTVSKYMQMENKEFYFIVTATDEDKENLHGTIECFRGFVDCLEGAVEKGIIYGVGCTQKEEVKQTKAMQEAYEMGKSV